MSFFRKRNTSQAASTAPPPNVTVVQPPSQALAQIRDNADRSTALGGSAQRDRDQNTQNPGMSAPPQAAPAPTNQAPRPTFPWSTKRIALPPPLLLARPGVPPVTAPSPSPFPRYGHSLPPQASQSGELFLFGGLVRESVRNDLYSFATRDLSATLVQTTGEIPPARVGHASALVSSVLIVWGGDTKQKDTDKQDEGLYLLNLGTREWTRVATRGPAPAGRYGHSVAMVGSRFFVFGGQVDGAFLNDLWSFDLNTLKTAPLWELVRPADGNEPPPRRTGHVMLSLDDTIYIFGGTDGSYHYNDTWAFDVNTRTWQELTCIGYIPVPREGHAAALVDDVMYVFGGRGVDGKDLNDLAAFKISTKRWFMFQNMGPAPSGRSGHAMATAGSRVFVLGGESFTSPKPDDPMMIHVLDTKHIKYPDPKNPSGNKVRQQNQGSQSGIPVNGLNRAVSPPVSSDTEDGRRGMSPVGGSRINNGMQMQMQPFPNPAAANPSSKRPPTRPPRDEIGANDLAEVRIGTSDAEGQDPRLKKQNPDNVNRSKSPTQQFGRSMSPTGPNSMGIGRNANTARSPSPVVPSDAFTKPGQMNGYGSDRGSPAVGRPGSTSNIAADLVQNLRQMETDLRQRDAELETLRKRETWMRAALSKASKAGFSWSDIPVDDDDDRTHEPETSDARKLVDLAFRLKQERATLQASMADQGRMATERIAELERVRAAALQEAAFWRAKLAAYEAGKPEEATRMENERAMELEKQVSRALNDRVALEKKVAQLNESLLTEGRLREQAEERVNDLNYRAQQAEAALHRTTTEHGDLLAKHTAASAELRSMTEKILSLQSTQQGREGEPTSNAELLELRASRDRHLRALEQAQTALKAASARADEVEEQWRRSNEQLQTIQLEYADLSRDLETKITEVDNMRAQLLDVENKFAKSREEADALRALTTGSLGELLDYHRDLRAGEERNEREQSEQVRILQTEMESLRKMLHGANSRYEEAQNELGKERLRARTIETDQLALRSQMTGLRAQLSNALADVARARKELSEKESELRESSKAAMDTEIRFKMFRNYLEENGVVVNEDEISGNSGNGSKMLELETQLAERSREQDALTRQLRNAREQSQLAEEKVAALQAELARAKERQSSDGTGDARVVDAERRLAEAESAHRDRLHVLENDYRAAVDCVKATESMLRKMKHELSKQKGLNASLQSELEGVRSGSEAGSRVRPLNGRVTPMSDDGQESALRAQLVEAQRQTQRLTVENQELHRRIELLQGDLERLRQELDNVRHDSGHSRGVGSTSDQLHRENESLRHQNEQLHQRIALLLDVKEDPNSMSSNLRASDSSLSPDASMDDWNRQYGGNSFGVQRIHDYEHDRR